MDPKRIPPPSPPDAGSALGQALRNKIRGEVRFDKLSRTIYATDASIYEIIPLGVVLPADVEDVVATITECQAHDIPVIARGAGTGLTGGAVGYGVLLDMSRFMNRVGPLDRARRTINVQPGVVLDELNTHLAAHGLQFGPDVATSSRATLGGMIANNSCGARSIIHGRTVDHVLELTVVLADGQVVTFKASPQAASDPDITVDRPGDIERELARIRDEHHEEITRRFPRVLRSNGGYGLDRLGAPGTRAEAIKLLCGSEGTLGIVVEAKLGLVPCPRLTGLVVLHFERLREALDVVPAVLAHEPAAVELVDHLIVEAGRANAALAKRCDFLKGNPSALLIVEFLDDDAGALQARMDALVCDRDVTRVTFARSQVLEADRQANVWNLRKSGLGLLMSRPGDRQPYGFVEDTAVDPSRLSDYMERFSAILQQENVEASVYAHASAGCLHVRPVVNLKDAGDVDRMRRIADQVSELVLEFGGVMTAEHGDGIVRSNWIERMYGARIAAAFGQVKRLFDPSGLLNPHKIIDPWPMTEHLRYGGSFASQSVKTFLDFSAYGGMAGLAGMCSGVGQCRQRKVGTMCPSYMATQGEQHTTRARANALRVALSNRGLLNGLDDPALAEVMDLCLSCKACKTECPTGVDMSRLKSEYLAQRNLQVGVSPQARLVADMPNLAALASRFPRLSNLVAQSKLVRAFVEYRYGLDRRVPPPRFARRSFRALYRRYRRTHPRSDAPRGSVIYFVDTWTKYYVPDAGIAAVTLLERAGFRVHCPRLYCCGRPAISKGLLAEARQLAEANIQRLAGMAAAGVPIVGTEPSCILTFLEEYPQLVRAPAARTVASRVMMIETLLRRVLDDDPAALDPIRRPTPLLYHAHCHQKSLVGSDDAVALIRHVCGESASEIASGCCGMAGSFGHETQHYEVARAVGEERLFPAVRNRGEASIAISGFSCRQQVEHHTGVRARHVVEYLADALA